MPYYSSYSFPCQAPFQPFSPQEHPGFLRVGRVPASARPAQWLDRSLAPPKTLSVGGSGAADIPPPVQSQHQKRQTIQNQHNDTPFSETCLSGVLLSTLTLTDSAKPVCQVFLEFY
jgi:hypothetical protein